MSKIMEVDCTRRCSSRKHGQELTSSITKRSVCDESLASFIKGTCANFTKSFDFEGRTALHMAASRGRTRLTSWLVRHSGEAFANARDRESGYTPLHRSIFYGQLHTAVALMKLGVNTDIVDKDDYRALEHAMLDRQYMYKHTGDQPSDVYVWGSNSNYTLGTGTQQQRNAPELLSFFSRTNTSIKQVCLGKFHSVWVSAAGEVWCGGQTARAGGAGGTALRPARLRLPEPCAGAALGLSSTALLLASGEVIQYTLNTTENSTQPSKNPTTLKPPQMKPLIKLSQPLGICGGRVHTVVWNARAVYTWGTNVGQLGHPREDKLVAAPKRVAISLHKEDVQLQLAAAGDAATLLTTSRGDVYLLHKYICRKIAVKQINLRQVCVEARVSEAGAPARVTALLLTSVGQLLLWQDGANTLTRCVFGLSHQIVVTHAALTHDAMYFATALGEVFIGHPSRRAPLPAAAQPISRERERDGKTALVRFLERDDCTRVRVARVPHAHRAVRVAVDAEGLNFACLQIKPSCGLASLPALSPSGLQKHMGALLEGASADDILHDVVFKVGLKQFPAHIFIVASSSELLYKLYQTVRADDPHASRAPLVALDNVLPEVFERILRFIYTGTCDVTELGPCGLKIRREDLISTRIDKDSNVDAETEVIENPQEVSAFEAHKLLDKNSNRKARNRRSMGSTVECPPRHLYCDPVKLVQAAAKRLQVSALHKLLDKFYYKDGTVRLKDGAPNAPPPRPRWERLALPALADTGVACRQGTAAPAHRCVLAARLDYFSGMFLHSWTESKSLSTVTLPIPHSILLPIIDFLYTDSCPEVETSDSIDFLCSFLIIADQLFITRLKEMCEVALANLVTLKNCAELCQFAHTYNAVQLKRCCMEFISLNLCCTLESRSLEILEETLLQDISTYYCKFNRIMSSRVITPFFNATSDDVIKEFGKRFAVDLDVTDDQIIKDDSVSEGKKKRSSKRIEYTENEKARMRYESVSSASGLDLSNDDGITLSLSKIAKDVQKETKKQEKWIEVPSTQQKQQKVIQARLKAITTAKDILNEPPSESFTKLIKNTSSTAISIESTPSTSRMSVSPKDSPSADSARSPQGNLTINHVGPKLSQKQRKKLAMQGESHTLDSFEAKLNTASSPEKPKNPWKMCETPATSCSPKERKAMEFNQILADQKKQKDDFSRIMSKPLFLTQVEDKAIEELERFYNAREVDDELITVRRIELRGAAAPQWLHATAK